MYNELREEMGWNLYIHVHVWVESGSAVEVTCTCSYLDSGVQICYFRNGCILFGYTWHIFYINILSNHTRIVTCTHVIGAITSLVVTRVS